MTDKTLIEKAQIAFNNAEVGGQPQARMRAAIKTVLREMLIQAATFELEMQIEHFASQNGIDLQEGQDD